VAQRASEEQAVLQELQEIFLEARVQLVAPAELVVREGLPILEDLLVIIQE
jgi:hypothetical protein